ncbi:hypothetical protein DICA3_F05578 [Diutina catenulata]
MVSDRRLATRKLPSKSIGKPKPAPVDDTPWDPKHFRLWIGNLGPDASDDLLKTAFAKYKSVSRVKAVLDSSGKPKGYGFVAFTSADDYLKAFQEMNGKYIGQHPVSLKRAVSEVPDKKKGKGKGKGKSK